ncbi:hypothetical protein [Candidatus Poriferisodalis sp.]|uniref:hypothetical protein n=1 Tax=Candidatus Poriferisodalis sp. TaxID=3101277 RepID=UPI003B02B3B5
MKVILWIAAIALALVVIAGVVGSADSDGPRRPLTDREIIEREAERFCDAHPELEGC